MIEMVSIKNLSRVSACSGALLFLFVSSPIQGHEIKVLLDRMTASKGDENVVFLSWGHILPTDGPVRGEDILQYRMHTPSGSVQYLATDTESDQRNVVHLEETGLYTAEAVRKPAVLTIFTLGDRHVHFVGPKTEVREGARIEDSFRSHQSAKSMIAAGKSDQKPVPLGHSLEIVPAVSAEGWVVGADIPFQVLFEGQPLSGKLFQAKPLNFKPDDVWTWTRPTDQSGTAILRPDRPGTWLLKATLERPTAEENRSQFDADHWTATLVINIRDK
jgi:uncharacterized GH25 family protein